MLTLACIVTERPWHLSARDRRPATEVPEQISRVFAEASVDVPAGIRVRLRAPVASSTARGLTELAEDEAADLVVVGSSRRGEPGRVSIERT